MEKNDFLARVLQRVPEPQTIKDYLFQHWSVPGKVTDEGFGLLAVPQADPQRIIERIMDVDHYVGNIGYVEQCRSISDPTYPAPEKVRFYQRIGIPVLGAMHNELVLSRVGSIQGYEVAVWTMLERETAALGSKQAIRNQYNDGAWLLAPGIIGYALSSAPRREDVGLLKWKAMTAGANVAASKVVRDNIEGMAKWAARAS